MILAFRAVLGAGVLGAVLAFCAPQLAAQPIPAALAAGFLDLPKRIAALAAVPEPAAQFLLCSVFVNWAGLCIHLQTSDAVAPAALPLRYHLRGKLCQCAVAAALSGPVYCCLRGQYTAAALFAAALVLLAGFLQKIKVKVERLPGKNGIIRKRKLGSDRRSRAPRSAAGRRRGKAGEREVRPCYFEKRSPGSASTANTLAKANAQQMVCVKKGLVPATGACGRFCYDPLKRVPEPHIFTALPCLEEGDYSL